MQYLALYYFGLLKTPFVSPHLTTPAASPYFDMLTDLRFIINTMSPEEVVPIFYPQIYSISDPNLTD